MILSKNIYFFGAFLVIIGLLPQLYAQESFEIYSPTYFNEQDNVFDWINYVDGEDLSFELCVDQGASNPSARATCDGRLYKIPLTEYKDSSRTCYFANYEIENLICNDDEFKLEVNYSIDSKERKIFRSFREQKQSLLLNHILDKDINSLDSLDLSYYLLVHSNIEDINSLTSQEVYDLLKEKRNNEKKCWPSNSCNIETTAKILRNLYLAGYDRDTRLLEDGKIYLEDNIIDKTNPTLDFRIDVNHEYDNRSHEVNCELAIDGDTTPRGYTWDEDSRNRINDEAEKTIEFWCDENYDEITLEVEGIDGNIMFKKTYKDSSSISYTIEDFSCIGRSSSCSYEVSISALSVYENEIKDYSLIDRYVRSKLDKDNENLYFIDTGDRYVDSGKYLLHEKVVELVDYLKYNQNNDGSWGSGSRDSKVDDTVWSLVGLRESDETSEYVEDGRKWVYFFEPRSGWGTVEKNAIAYFAIKEQIKPYLKINAVNVIDDEVTFRIENPTIYNLKELRVDFDDNLKKHLAYKENFGEVLGEESFSFKVNLKENFYGNEAGFMRVRAVTYDNKEEEYLKFPILLKGIIPFSLENEIDLAISDNQRDLLIPLSSNMANYNISCSYNHPITNKEENVYISDGQENIIIENEILEPINKTFLLNCEYKESSFTLESKMVVSAVDKTFEVNKEEVIINSSSGFAIEIENIHDDIINVQVTIEGELKDLLLTDEGKKVIARADTRSLYFNINENLNLGAFEGSSSFIVVEDDNSYIKRIPVSVQILENQNSSISIWWYIIIGLIIILIMAIIIIRYIRATDDEDDEDDYDEDYDDYYLEDSSIDYR
jgi:hypothetical protein